jgi:hypothetical protein
MNPRRLPRDSFRVPRVLYLRALPRTAFLGRCNKASGRRHALIVIPILKRRNNVFLRLIVPIPGTDNWRTDVTAIINAVTAI